LGETLASLDRNVRGQFLAHFFKSLAQIELSDEDSAAAWDLVLERHKVCANMRSCCLRSMISSRPIGFTSKAQTLSRTNSESQLFL